MNNFSGVGRLTKAPESRTILSTGTSVVTFTIAITRAYKRDVTDFINCQAWGKTAEIVAKYVHKGDQIGIQGELNIDKYEDKYYTKINVQSVTLLGGKKQSDEPTPFDDKTDVAQYVPSGDVPF